MWSDDSKSDEGSISPEESHINDGIGKMTLLSRSIISDGESEVTDDELVELKDQGCWGNTSLESHFAAYAIEVKNCAKDGSSILYHPNNSVCNYVLLDLLRRSLMEKSDRHILITTPSDIAVKQHIFFLKRHLLTESIGSSRNNKIIVVRTSSLLDLLQDELPIELYLMIVLDCAVAMQNESMIKLMAFLKTQRSTSQGSSVQPIIHCFTSCMMSESSVSETVFKLQDFFGCKLASLSDPLIVERIFSDSTPSICYYDKKVTLSKRCLDALQILDEAIRLCSNFNFQFNSKFSQIHQSSSQNLVKDILSQIKVHLDALGEFGGSIATLISFSLLVRLFTFAESSPGHTTKHMLCHLICILSRFRKAMEENMEGVPSCERIEKFSSPQVQTLLNHLRKIPSSYRVMIVVSDLHKASILSLILKKLVEYSKSFSHLSPDILINGSSIPVSESWEDTLSWNRNMEIYSRFVSGEVNVLILSGELKCMDLPCADLVLVMDEIETFPCFLQVKNLVKRRNGKLLILTTLCNQTSYEERMKTYSKQEKEMKKILSQADAYRLCHTNCKSWFATGQDRKVSAVEAIDLISRYCLGLPHDKFTHHPLLWSISMSEDADTKVYSAALVLPRVFAVQNFQGSKRKSLQAAQQDAALKACKELYVIKELSDLSIFTLQSSRKCSEDLSSLGKLDADVNGKQCESSSPEEEHYEEDEEVLCDILYPESLTGAQPKPDHETYIHIIKMWPVSEAPPPGDNRKTALYELLCDRKTFAILSSKPLPKMCQFPVFMFGHELSVELETSKSTLQLSRDCLVRLRKFHCGIFMNVLPLIQQFMQFDVFNKHNSFLIAPLTAEGNIDWNVVDNNACIPEPRELTSEEKFGLVCTPETYEKTMVKPWYRPLMRDQIYLVATVCLDMCAESCFPTEDFESFMDYYQEKYNITLDRPELPLLEVYLINTKINGLLPRPRNYKLRHEEKMEEFREHMVPELCMALQFPAALWLKLSGLPSVLHRFCRLIIAEELRVLILNNAGAGTTGENWQRMNVDLSCVKETSSLTSKVPPSTVKRGLVIGNVKLEDRKMKARCRKPWKQTQEPVDIFRSLESLNMVEIRYFDEFINKSMSNLISQPCQSTQQINSPEQGILLGTFSEESNLPEPDVHLHTTSNESTSCLHGQSQNSINLIRPFVEKGGPEQHELLEVLTSASSNDAVNMDRLQIIGNAFLKLTITVFAYKFCRDSSKSNIINSLHQIRKTFLGKSNLVDCAEKNKLCNRIKVLDFSPGEWIPPSFSTPLMLKEVIKQQDINPNVLQNISLTLEEQVTGVINPETEDEILEELTNTVLSGPARREEFYVDRQLVPHQTAASCVEALVGTYFKNCGWEGALKVIGWLQLLPSTKLNNLLDFENLESAKADLQQDPAIDLLPVPLNSLELSLSYSFVNKALLAQAIIHDSYDQHPSLGSMIPLSFLGSGILDFLLTSYIFENFLTLSPHQLQRLRDFLCSASTLASLAVKQNFHKYLLSASPSLLDAVERYVKYQNSSQLPADEAQLLFEEHECETALQVEVPVVLANLLPSIVGAIYLDSGNNLLTVWSCIQSIFLPELSTWSSEIPLSVVELLKDLSPAAHQVKFMQKVEVGGKVQVTCRILMDNTREEIFIAKGHDFAKTETLAAKLALRKLLGFKSLSY